MDIAEQFKYVSIKSSNRLPSRFSKKFAEKILKKIHPKIF